MIGQTNGAAAVEATDIVKNFGSLRALGGTSLSLYRGEITAVIGDNGAGKSTLLKVLSGEHLPDGGQLRFGGELTELHSTADAQDLGVETVYQDLSLAPDLSVSENVLGTLAPPVITSVVPRPIAVVADRWWRQGARALCTCQRRGRVPVGSL